MAYWPRVLQPLAYLHHCTDKPPWACQGLLPRKNLPPARLDCWAYPCVHRRCKALTTTAPPSAPPWPGGYKPGPAIFVWFGLVTRLRCNAYTLHCMHCHQTGFAPSLRVGAALPVSLLVDCGNAVYALHTSTPDQRLSPWVLRAGRGRERNPLSCPRGRTTTYRLPAWAWVSQRQERGKVKEETWAHRSSGQVARNSFLPARLANSACQVWHSPRVLLRLMPHYPRLGFSSPASVDSRRAPAKGLDSSIARPPLHPKLAPLCGASPSLSAGTGDQGSPSPVPINTRWTCHDEASANYDRPCRSPGNGRTIRFFLCLLYPTAPGASLPPGENPSWLVAPSPAVRAVQ